MNTQERRRLLVYGFLVSAVHFTVAVLFNNARLLLQRPEDMIGSGGTKPHWPPHPLADALESVSEILRLPLDWLWTPAMPGVITGILFVANSCLWGFLVVVLFRFVFTRSGFHHAPKAA